jgi:hypothetical protein
MFGITDGGWTGGRAEKVFVRIGTAEACSPSFGQEWIDANTLWLIQALELSITWKLPSDRAVYDGGSVYFLP